MLAEKFYFMNFDVAPKWLKLIINGRIKLIKHGIDNLWVWYIHFNLSSVMEVCNRPGISLQSQTNFKKVGHFFKKFVYVGGINRKLLNSFFIILLKPTFCFLFIFCTSYLINP